MKKITSFIILIFLSMNVMQFTIHLFIDDHEKSENYGLELRYQMVWECNSHFIIHPSLDKDHTLLEVFTVSLSGLTLKFSSARIETRIGMQNTHIQILSTCNLRGTVKCFFLHIKTIREMTWSLYYNFIMKCFWLCSCWWACGIGPATFLIN